jgi:large subunit ribosomal protein L5
MSTFKKLYEDEIRPKLAKDFKYKSSMEIPKLEKIVINMGVGEASQDAKFLEAAAKDLEIIAGQKPVITKAKRSISGFKLRAGMAIGAKVTLRGENMYNFLEKLIKVAIPRVRDFRGLTIKHKMVEVIYFRRKRTINISRNRL